jgi:hypothetical protein
MIRILFWLALLANLALFSYIRWGGSLAQDTGAFQPPLHPEQIKLLGFSAAAQSAVVGLPHEQLGQQSPPAPPALPSTGPDSVVAKPVPAVCLEWGEFSGSDLSRAHADLAGLKLGSNLSQREVEHSIGYWVYIPPLKSHAEVINKISQLKKLGIHEYFVVSEKGKWQNAISLGVFKAEDVARNFLDHLKAKGVRSAVMGERQTRLKFIVFVLKNPDASTLSSLAEWQKEFTGIEMKSTACD